MTGLVVSEYRAHYDVVVDGMVVAATVRGHFHTMPKTQFPKVGDQVCCESVSEGKVVITEVLPRKNEIARYVERSGETQVMVANIDYMFIVMGLDNDFNVRRLERYVALAEESHVTPIIVCTKVDTVPDRAPFSEALAMYAVTIPIHFVSSRTGEGLDAVAQYLLAGTTTVLLGSSGAGKSSLINQLVADAAQFTQAVRSDDRGRHTTTHRQLFVAHNGGFIIDTPGMRELAVLDPEDAAASQFPEVAALVPLCRFSNCDHDKSAGCAIQAALAEGEIDEAAVRAYFKLAHSEERLRRVRS